MQLRKRRFSKDPTNIFEEILDATPEHAFSKKVPYFFLQEPIQQIVDATVQQADLERPSGYSWRRGGCES